MPVTYWELERQHAACRRARLEMIDALNECYEFIENYADVDDGDYGMPKPNKAMRLLQTIDEVLGRRP